MVFSPSAAFAASMAVAKAAYQLVLPPTVSDAAICLLQTLQMPVCSSTVWVWVFTVTLLSSETPLFDMALPL